MHRTVLTFAAVFGGGLLLLLGLGLFERRSEAFTLGVPPTLGAPLRPGGQVCQGPIDTTSGFERVGLQLGSPRTSVVPVAVTVRGWRNGTRIGAGRALATFGGPHTVSARVGHVDEGRSISLCLRNDGDRPMLVFGSPLAAPGSSARYEGRGLRWDMSASFLRADGATLLSLTPDMVQRAALFRGQWIGDWAV